VAGDTWHVRLIDGVGGGLTLANLAPPVPRAHGVGGINIRHGLNPTLFAILLAARSATKASAY
jgi:hypothetical protein